MSDINEKFELLKNSISEITDLEPNEKVLEIRRKVIAEVAKVVKIIGYELECYCIPFTYETYLCRYYTISEYGVLQFPGNVGILPISESYDKYLIRITDNQLETLLERAIHYKDLWLENFRNGKDDIN
jgi:hypothetical protein